MDNTMSSTPAMGGTGTMDGSGQGSPQWQNQNQAGTDVAGQAKQAASHLTEQARTQITHSLNEQKGRVAETVGTVAEAIRQTGQQLRTQDQSFIGEYADSAAEMVERVGGYIREKQIEDVAYDLESFARRQPALFFGGAFAMGFLLARFMKASGEHVEPHYEGRSHHRLEDLKHETPYRQMYGRGGEMAGTEPRLLRTSYETVAPVQPTAMSGAELGANAVGGTPVGGAATGPANDDITRPLHRPQDNWGTPGTGGMMDAEILDTDDADEASPATTGSTEGRY